MRVPAVAAVGALLGACSVAGGGGGTATTNAAGRFRLEGISAGQVVLVVRAAGFLELRVPNVAVAPNAQVLRIELDPTPNFLEHVQVTATKEPLSIGEVAECLEITESAVKSLIFRATQTLREELADLLR